MHCIFAPRLKWNLIETFIQDADGCSFKDEYSVLDWLESLPDGILYVVKKHPTGTDQVTATNHRVSSMASPVPVAPKQAGSIHVPVYFHCCIRFWCILFELLWPFQFPLPPIRMVC